MNTAKPGKQASRLRRLCSVGVFHRQVCRNSYRRRAFRRRDACALCKAKRLRRLPGCATYAFSGCQANVVLPRCVREKYRRRAFRRRDACSPGCATYAFGGCQAALCSPKQVEKVTDAERFAGETPALQAAQRTPSVVARLCNVRLRAGCDGANWVRKTEHTGSLWLATLRSELRKSPPPVNSQARLRLGFGGIIN